MQDIRKITDDIYYIGCSDRKLKLFENIYPVPRGVSYNSYVLLDEKTVLFDTADDSVSLQFKENLKAALNGRKLDYMVIHHMEPDHSALIREVIEKYPEVKVVTTAKALEMISQFQGLDLSGSAIAVKEGDTLSTGKHILTFVMAPMVHWPEVMVSYDSFSGVLFSADAFGTFGALSGNLWSDEYDFDRDFLDDARRYFLNIVGKYGVQVMNLLKKASALPIKMILPLHGPLWRGEHISYYVEKHKTWASYTPEKRGALINYASIYGDTENAAYILASKLADKGVKDIRMYDLSHVDKSYVLADSFKYSTVVFMSPTYNLEIFTPMRELLEDLKEHLYQNRDVAIIDNGSWALQAGKKMEEILSSMKDIRIINKTISIKSSLKEEQLSELDALADKIVDSVNGSL